MRDQTLLLSTGKVPPSAHEQKQQHELTSINSAALFLNDWPKPPPSSPDNANLDPASLAEVRKWRIQTILAVSPFGIPSLALAHTYERMFGCQFNLKDFKCDTLDELINKMSGILVVQQPCSTTAVLFPQNPHDIVLHDVRLGHDFTSPDYDALDASTNQGLISEDSSDLVYRAWLNRDEEFPPDVVIVGEPYEQLLKIASANIDGSQGLYQANMISVASPESIFIRMKTSDESVKRISGLSAEIDAYFKQSKHPIDSYNVPREFVSTNFPCLLYSNERSWERCLIVGVTAGGSKILVESVDFGGVYAVYLIFLYLIPRKFHEIPRQTLAVSLAGIKPSGQKWSETVGARLRCFCMEDYWLDVLLIDRKFPKLSLQKRKIKNTSNQRIASDSDLSPNFEKRRSTVTDRVSYEAIFVDRNYPAIDVYIHDILVMETYAKDDAARKNEIENFKARMKETFEKIPRPVNRLEPKLL